MDSWIRCLVDLYAVFLFFCFFFSDVLTYCVMLQAFICYCSSSDVYDVRACARVCVFFIGIVQRNWACLTWKSAIEIKSLLLFIIINVFHCRLSVAFQIQVVPSFSVMSSCHLLLGRPLGLFPLLGCHSVHRFVHLVSSSLAIWPAHFHFYFSVYSMISMIFVLFLISEHLLLQLISDGKRTKLGHESNSSPGILLMWTSFLTSQQTRTSLWNDSKTSLHWWCFYEGHTLCFAIWFFNNSDNHSVYSSFSKKPPSACIHLTLLSNQLSMTPDHVYSGMSKMTPSKNARASSAFWNCFPFICLLTEGNKNQSQGLSQMNMVGGRPAEHHWRLKSQELQPLCAHWHCHDGAVGNRHSFRDAVYTMPGRLWAKSDWHTSQP